MKTTRRLFRFKVRGHLFGAWTWHRVRGNGRLIRDGGQGFERYGVVLRVGPLGHLQLTRREKRWSNGRRNLHSWSVDVWGVTGRRRKRGISVSVFH